MPRVAADKDGFPLGSMGGPVPVPGWPLSRNPRPGRCARARRAPMSPRSGLHALAIKPATGAGIQVLRALRCPRRGCLSQGRSHLCRLIPRVLLIKGAAPPQPHPEEDHGSDPSRRMGASPVLSGPSFETQPYGCSSGWRGVVVEALIEPDFQMRTVWASRSEPALQAGGKPMSKSQRLRAGAFRLQPEGLIEGWRERRPARLYVLARAGAALAHGSFRRTGAAGLRVPPWPEAPLPEPGAGSRAARRQPGPLARRLRALLRDRAPPPHLATPRERAPRGAGLSKDIA